MNRVIITVLVVILVCAIIGGIIYVAAKPNEAEALMDEKEWILIDEYPGLARTRGWFIVRSYEITENHYHYEFIFHQKGSGNNYEITYDQPVDLTKETVHLIQYEDVTDRHF